MYKYLNHILSKWQRDSNRQERAKIDNAFGRYSEIVYGVPYIPISMPVTNFLK